MPGSALRRSIQNHPRGSVDLPPRRGDPGAAARGRAGERDGLMARGLWTYRLPTCGLRVGADASAGQPLR